MNNVNKGFILLNSITKDFILINKFLVIYNPPVIALAPLAPLAPLATLATLALKFVVTSLLFSLARLCLNIILYNPPVFALNFAPFAPLALALALSLSGSSSVSEGYII